MSKLTHHILYLDRQKIIYFSFGLPAPLTLEIPTSILFDMDIVDSESLGNLLSNWFDKNQIIPTDIIVILSHDVCYEESSTSTKIDTFLGDIPYKNLFSREYNFGTDNKLIALNKDFYEPIIRCLEKYHFNVLIIIPSLVLDHFQLKLIDFSPKEAKEIYQKYKQLEPFSLISPKEIGRNFSARIYHEKTDNKRTYILLGVFSFLLIIFLVFFFLRPYLYQKQLNKTISYPSIRR